MNLISVLVVDDHTTFLEIVIRFLQSQEDVVIVGTAHDGKEALLSARTLQPQVILLDLAMPGLSGLEVIPHLHAILPTVAIIIMSLLDVDGYRQAALALGATAFVSKSTLATDLLPTIRQVAQASRPPP